MPELRKTVARKTRIIVVGQIPPPFLGQNLQIARIVEHSFEHLQVIFVPWSLNRHANSIGRFGARKIFSLLGFCRRLRRAVSCNEGSVFYLPVAPGTWAGLLRDLVILRLGHAHRMETRILAFHAAGQADFVSKTKLRSFLAQRTYGESALGIVNTEDSLRDAYMLGCSSVAVIPYGISDLAAEFKGAELRHTGMASFPFLLYVGKVCEEKGVLELVAAFQEISDQYPDLCLRLVGPSTKEVNSFLKVLASEDPKTFKKIALDGPLGPQEIAPIYRSASIFCFPSRAPYESFGLVVAEAMSHSLPIVASRWRGMPHMIEHEVSGMMHEAGDSRDLARCLDAVLRNSSLRTKLGLNARSLFEQKYTESVYWRQLESALLNARQPR